MGKWIFMYKFHSNGSLASHKGCWVVHGFSQQHGVNYDETFGPVVKPATIRAMLSITALRGWPIHHLDMKNSFLHGDLGETVYCQQSRPLNQFATCRSHCMVLRRLLAHSISVCKLHMQEWLLRGEVRHVSIYKDPEDVTYLLLYVEDIVLMAASSPAYCNAHR